MKQRDAVYSAIISAFNDAGIDFEDGMNASEFMSKEIRSNVHTIVTDGFKSGTVEFEKTPANAEKMASDSKLSTYVSGLVSNWLRKDTRLNGNTKYVAKNPGSRAGASDEQLKALRLLANQFKNDSAKLVAINKQITTRTAEIQAAKVKSVKVDLSVLSPELLAELGIEHTDS